MLVLLALALASPAHACTGAGGWSLRATEDLPVDAAVVVTGVALRPLAVVDSAGAAVSGAITTQCTDDGGPLETSCRITFTREAEWTPGATYVAQVTSDEYAATAGEHTYEAPFSIATDGHPATEAEGAPDVEWIGARPNDDDLPCAYEEPVDYRLRLHPAGADPDGLADLRLERKDGFTLFFAVDAHGEETVEDFSAPAVAFADDCLRVSQIDGAGRETEPSPWRCNPEGPDEGCASAGGGAGGGALGLAVAALIASGRRARPNPIPANLRVRR